MFDEEQKRRFKPILLILILLIVVLAGNYVRIKNKVDTAVNRAVESLPNKDKNIGANSMEKVLGKMKITSTAFENNGKIPEKYTCKGVNVNPPLSFAEVPAEAKSLILIVDDPDAPVGTWTHWIVLNIDPSVREIGEDNIPKGGVLGTNDFGKGEYSGPCPPFGVHRYFYKVYALDKALDLEAGADKDMVEKEMAGSVIDSAELIGLFGK